MITRTAEATRDFFRRIPDPALCLLIVVLFPAAAYVAGEIGTLFLDLTNLDGNRVAQVSDTIQSHSNQDF